MGLILAALSGMGQGLADVAKIGMEQQGRSDLQAQASAQQLSNMKELEQNKADIIAKTLATERARIGGLINGAQGQATGNALQANANQASDSADAIDAGDWSDPAKKQAAFDAVAAQNKSQDAGVAANPDVQMRDAINILVKSGDIDAAAKLAAADKNISWQDVQGMLAASRERVGAGHDTTNLQRSQITSDWRTSNAATYAANRIEIERMKEATGLNKDARNQVALADMKRKEADKIQDLLSKSQAAGADEATIADLTNKLTTAHIAFNTTFNDALAASKGSGFKPQAPLPTTGSTTGAPASLNGLIRRGG